MSCGVVENSAAGLLVVLWGIGHGCTGFRDGNWGRSKSGCLMYGDFVGGVNLVSPREGQRRFHTTRNGKLVD